MPNKLTTVVLSGTLMHSYFKKKHISIFLIIILMQEWKASSFATSSAPFPKQFNLLQPFFCAPHLQSSLYERGMINGFSFINVKVSIACRYSSTEKKCKSEVLRAQNALHRWVKKSNFPTLMKQTCRIQSLLIRQGMERERRNRKIKQIQRSWFMPKEDCTNLIRCYQFLSYPVNKLEL